MGIVFWLVHKDVLFQAVEGLAHLEKGKGEVDADMGLPVKASAVLEAYANVVGAFEKVVKGYVLSGEVVATVKEKHIGSLGFANLYALEVVCDKVASIGYVG